MMMKKIILLFSVCIFSAHITAQKIALKTNLFYDATVTPNLGIEAGLAPRWTIDLSAGSPPFIFRENRKWKHWLVQDKARYCLCESFYGHFFDLHAGGGEFKNTTKKTFFFPTQAEISPVYIINKVKEEEYSYG